MGVVSPDGSEYQKLLTLLLNRRVPIFRVCFGASYLDPHFLGNAAIAKQMYAAGSIDGAILYAVFLDSQSVVSQYDAVWKAIGPKIPDWLLGVETDIETWRGTSYQNSGNSSSDINKLMARHAHQFGHWNAAPWYGNVGDLAEVYPDRDPRFWGTQAAYTSSLVFKNLKGARAQQYTDGQTKWGATPRVLGKRLPISSVPWGNCDHNYLDFKNGAALRAFMRPETVKGGAKPKPPVVPPPKPPVAVKPHYLHGGSHLKSPNGAHAWFVLNDGRLQQRHNGKAILTLGKKVS